DSWVWIASSQLHPQDVVCGWFVSSTFPRSVGFAWPAQCKHSVGRGEEQGVTSAARQELDCAVRLPLVCFKAERHSAEFFAHKRTYCLVLLTRWRDQLRRSAGS